MRFLIGVLACGMLSAQAADDLKNHKAEKCTSLADAASGQNNNMGLLNQLRQMQSMQLEELSETAAISPSAPNKQPLRQFCGVSSDLLHPFEGLTGERPKSRLQFFSLGSAVGVAFVHFFGNLRKPAIKTEHR